MFVRQIWPSRPALANPFADLESRHRELLRFLDAAAAESSNEVTAGVFPPLNLTQDDNHFYLRAEIPGIRPTDLTITALRNRISISGRREIPAEHERVSYHRKERADGEFNRTIALPTDIDAEDIEARCADGILSLKVAKVAEAKPRQITVKT